MLFGRAAGDIWPGGKCYLAGRQELFNLLPGGKMLFGRAAGDIWLGGKCYLAGRQELFGRQLIPYSLVRATQSQSRNKKQLQVWFKYLQSLISYFILFTEGLTDIKKLLKIPLHCSCKLFKIWVARLLIVL